MALRVLLADESSTIKKVFQLALQDFAVDVRPVNVGVDVVPVALNFKPDIIFADVLLQKKSGYDVCAEVKQHATLKNVPVVLMWSGFMELDEDKLQACMANAQLEKPFDVSGLRKLVTDLVPRTQGSRISQFLTFPPLPEMEEPRGAGASAGAAPAAPSIPAPTLDDEDFRQVPIPQMKGAQKRDVGGENKFRLNLKPEELDASHVPVEYDLPSDNIQVEDLLQAPTEEESVEEFSFRNTKVSNVQTRITELDVEELLDEDIPEPHTLARTQTTIGSPSPLGPTAPAQHAPAQAPAPMPQMTEEQLERIIREQSKEVIEAVVWKVLPELATQIIERELNKLLRERDTHP